MTPGCLVSADGETWTPAENIAELEMEWMVQLPGRAMYGPLNLNAIIDLVRDGALPSDVRVISRLTQAAIDVRDLLGPAGAQEPEAPRTEGPEVAAGPGPAPAVLQPAEREAGKPAGVAADEPPETLEQQNRALVEALGTARRRLAEKEQELSSRAAKALKQVEDLTQRTAQAEASARKALAENAQACAGLDEERRVHGETRRRLAELESECGRQTRELAEASGRLSEAAAALERAQAEHERTRQAGDARIAELADQVGALESLRSEGEQRLHERDRELAQARESESAARREYEEGEQAHAARARDMEGEVRALQDVAAALQRQGEEQQHRYESLRETTSREIRVLTEQRETLARERDSAIHAADQTMEQLNREQAGHRDAAARASAREQELAQRIAEIEERSASAAEVVGRLTQELNQQKALCESAVETGKQSEQLYRRQIKRLYKERLATAGPVVHRAPDAKPGAPAPAPAPAPATINWIEPDRASAAAAGAAAGQGTKVPERLRFLEEELRSVEAMLEEARQELVDKERSRSRLQEQIHERDEELGTRLSAVLQDLEEKEAECRILREQMRTEHARAAPAGEATIQEPQTGSSRGSEAGRNAKNGVNRAPIPGSPKILTHLETQAREDLAQWQKLKDQGGKPSGGKNWLRRKPAKDET